MDNNIYLISDLQTRLDELEAGAINKLNWDHDIYGLDEWLAQISRWDSAELYEILNPMLEKVNKILSRDSIIINKIVVPAEFFLYPEEASPDRVKKLNFRRREELLSYKTLLLKGIELTKAELDNEAKGDVPLTGHELSYIKAIEKELSPFKGKNIFEDDYSALVWALDQGFKTQKFTSLTTPILVYKMNAAIKLATPLKRIFKACSENRKLTFEYLKFAQESILLFSNLRLDEDDLQNSPLYRCFTKEA